MDQDQEQLPVKESAGQGRSITCTFTLNPFDKKVIEVGDWLAFADRNY